MDKKRIEELKKRPFAQIFPEAIKKIEAGVCPICGEKINMDDFRDDLSRKEFRISGLCQKCQDSVFNI